MKGNEDLPASCTSPVTFRQVNIPWVVSWTTWTTKLLSPLFVRQKPYLIFFVAVYQDGCNHMVWKCYKTKSLWVWLSVSRERASNGKGNAVVLTGSVCVRVCVCACVCVCVWERERERERGKQRKREEEKGTVWAIGCVCPWVWECVCVRVCVLWWLCWLQQCAKENGGGIYPTERGEGGRRTGRDEAEWVREGGVCATVCVSVCVCVCEDRSNLHQLLHSFSFLYSFLPLSPFFFFSLPYSVLCVCAFRYVRRVCVCVCVCVCVRGERDKVLQWFLEG